MIIKLCVLLYVRTNCGLRTVVKILEIFDEVFESKCGKIPCYNTVENWMKKLGLSVYENDRKPCPGKKYAMVIDESIMINREKLLLILGIPAEHQGRAVKHEDVTVIGMEVNHNFTGDDINGKISDSVKEIGENPEYVISDQGHNLTNGIAKSGFSHHIDISHAMGTFLKHAYGKQADFMIFTQLLGHIRLQYHLTDKAYLLPPNMRSIARFMNMSSWVDWASAMLNRYDDLSDEMKDAYSFIPDNRELLEELSIAVNAVRYIEDVCKNEGFCIATCKKCRKYIIQNVVGNAGNRRAMFGIEILNYLKKEESLLIDCMQNDNISSDIIESNFGIYKDKKSPNKLYGITPFVLFIPLYPKIVNQSVTEVFDFKERLVNVKLKDVEAFAKKHMSKNWVTERTKTLKKAS